MLISPLIASVISLWIIFENMAFFKASGSATECVAFMISALVPITLFLTSLKVQKTTFRDLPNNRALVMAALLYMLAIHPIISICLFLPAEFWELLKHY
jgi:hypothetical protein